MGEQELVFGSCVHYGVSVSWENSSLVAEGDLWVLWKGNFF